MGNRFSKVDQPRQSGMYAWKVLPLLLLSFIDRLVLGIKITDFHQGFRVYTRKLFNDVNFETNSNNYLFSFELITQSVFNKLKLDEVPVETKYEGEKRGASLKHSLKYSIDTFKVLALYLLAKIGIKTPIFLNPQGSLKARITKLL